MAKETENKPRIISVVEADEAPSIRRVLELDKGEIFNLVMATKEKILWGVYGDHGKLVKITECRDVGRLTDSDEDAEAYQNLYLKGLLEEPASFGGKYKDEVKKTMEEVKKYLQDHHVACVKYSYQDKGVRKEKLVGMGVLSRGEGVRSHIANLGRLYVHPAHRQRALASEMVAHLLDLASKDGFKQVHLVVTASNKFAIQFYKKLGFVPGEIEYQAAFINDEYFVDWLHMSLSMQHYKLDQEKKSSPQLPQS